ncbi:alternate-type signal peptide domain-containing protein [Cellulomonas denverensis]|uniref:alternate-type signal peptide domain-containing protein n=1 Tax=Cellulomonas denverensis TaxID=264297 RepID=UPI0035EA8781
MTGGSRIRRLIPPALATVVVAVLLLGGTMALWAANAEFGGGQVIAGDLALTSGATTWEQVTPGVSSPRSGQFDGSVPQDFFTMPGDVIEIRQPVTTELTGDNLSAGMTVRFADPSAVAPDIAACRIDVGFVVLDDAGTQVAPATGAAELGSTVAVPGLTGADAGVTDDWTVVIRVDVLGDYVWTDGDPAAGTGLWSTGEVLVELQQVRQGAGFGGAA